MSADEIVSIFMWWVVWVGLGLSSVPVTRRLFRVLWLEGYFLAKALGILVPAFVLWYASSWRVLEYGRASILLMLFLWVGLNLWFARNGNRRIRLIFDGLKSVLIIEVTFLVFFLGYVGIRSHAPNLNVLEKFMNLGFINAVNRTTYMPPEDIWYSGEVMPYYYFGHYLAAFVTKLSGTKAPLAFNFYLASLAGLLAQLVFGLSASLAKVGWPARKAEMIKSSFPTLAGILGVWFLLLRGNAHTLFYYLHRWLGFSSELIPNPQVAYVVGDAVQAIPLTMEEMPIYSLLVGDLHAHLMNLPILLVFLSVLVVTVRSTRLEVWRGVLLGWLIGIAYMTSSWDAPILVVLLVASLGLKVGQVKEVKRQLWGFGGAVGLAVLLTIGPFVLAWQRPFYGVVLNTQLSPLLPWLSVWGFELVVLLLLFPFVRRLKQRGVLNQTDWMVGVWLLVAVGYILLPEVVYLKLVPQGITLPDERSNTYLKAAFLGFSLLSVCLAYGLGRVVTFSWKKPWSRYLKWLIVVLVILGISVSWYPVEIVKSYYNRLRTPKGLDGAAWFKQQWPDDWAAVEWLSKQSGEMTMVEAVGEPFSYYGRVSAYTGIPTVVNWLQHEYLWRTMPPEKLQQRVEDAEMFYAQLTPEDYQRILTIYKPTYLIYGSLERERYPNFDENMLLSLGAEVAFSSIETKIFRLPIIE